VKNTISIFKRELRGYFLTPVAYIFMILFLWLVTGLTFWFSRIYENRQADLAAFFNWMPILFILFMPAISMRLWAEERKSGTIELLMTLPVTMGQAVMGKFLAAWAFATVSIVMTFPMWVTIGYLGNPDHGTIVTGYLGSILLAGAFIAIGAFVSSMTKNQVVAFIITAFFGFVFFLIGFPPAVELMKSWFFPEVLLDTVSSLSFFTHFDGLSRGLVEARALAFFGSLIVLSLFLNAIFLDAKKAD